MPNANRSSWKVLPMPAAREEIDLRLQFDDAQFAVLRRGLIPRDMDDRWFMFVEDDWLFIHRSWTGACIFAAQFRAQDGGVEVTNAWASRNADQYRSPGREHDTRLMRELIFSQLTTPASRPSFFHTPAN